MKEKRSEFWLQLPNGQLGFAGIVGVLWNNRGEAMGLFGIISIPFLCSHSENLFSEACFFSFFFEQKQKSSIWYAYAETAFLGQKQFHLRFFCFARNNYLEYKQHFLFPTTYKVLKKFHHIKICKSLKVFLCFKEAHNHSKKLLFLFLKI